MIQNASYNICTICISQRNINVKNVTAPRLRSGTIGSRRRAGAIHGAERAKEGRARAVPWRVGDAHINLNSLVVPPRSESLYIIWPWIWSVWNPRLRNECVSSNAYKLNLNLYGYDQPVERLVVRELLKHVCPPLLRMPRTSNCAGDGYQRSNKKLSVTKSKRLYY